MKGLEKNKTNKTFVTLFSGGGIGCYGFKLQGFKCIATLELLKKRIDVQKINNKCEYETGYICDDIKLESTKNKIYDEIDFWKKTKNIEGVDVLIATPPCQGMSTANSKKNASDLFRNSLVVESIEIINKIKPNFFILENVPAFMKTDCIAENERYKIGDFLYQRLSSNYSIYSDVINFKDYGVPSSRKRCLVIGVKNNLSSFISPFELFPDKQKPKTIRETIFQYKRLKEMGEIDPNDIYHFFRPYSPHMRDWIKDIKEGQSAYENIDQKNIPHTIKNGQIIFNKNSMGGKYKRQLWDQVAPCIHTRNDVLASQNTIHPEDDRVFSIRELMDFMSVPKSFKWTNQSESELNNLSLNDKKKFLKEIELNARQILGEGVPTLIFESIAKKINLALSDKNIEKYKNNYEFEFNNPNRKINEAFYTDKFIINEVIKFLPDPNLFPDEINILEPSVGLGSFLPLLFKKYESVKKINIDVIDIDATTIKQIKKMFNKENIPNNVEIKFIHDNFLLKSINKKYDLVVGNPPFKKMDAEEQKLFNQKYGKMSTKNTIAFFLLKSLDCAKFVSLILPKNFLIAPQYNSLREIISQKNIYSIIDFETWGFKNVVLETICLSIKNENINDNNVKILNFKNGKKFIQKKSYITDNTFPNWIIYRDDFFDSILKKMKQLNIFDVYRDREITNKFLSSKNETGIKVLRSRNIQTNGEINEIPNYDKFLNKQIKLEKLSMYKYLDDDSVFLCPNFTTNIRVIKKPKNTLVNGSLAILKLKNKYHITEKQIRWFSSDEFINFYKISNNYQRNTINLDKNAIFYFGEHLDE